MVEKIKSCKQQHSTSKKNQLTTKWNNFHVKNHSLVYLYAGKPIYSSNKWEIYMANFDQMDVVKVLL